MKTKPKELCGLVLKEIKAANSFGLKQVSNIWYHNQEPKPNIIKSAAMDTVYVPTAYIAGFITGFLSSLLKAQKPNDNYNY